MATNKTQSAKILNYVTENYLLYVEPFGINIGSGVANILFGSWVILDMFVPHYTDQQQSASDDPGYTFLSNGYSVLLIGCGAAQYAVGKGRQTGACSKSVYDALQKGCILCDILHFYAAYKYFVTDKGNSPKYKKQHLIHILLTGSLALARMYQVFALNE